MPFTKYAIESFISKRVAEATECNAIAVGAEFPDYREWISALGLGFILNGTCRTQFPFATQFTRRTAAALEYYTLGREALLQHVARGGRTWSDYFRALQHFEVAIGHLYQAYDHVRKKLDKQFFKTNDGSSLDRLNKIHNTSKHDVADQDQPLWITNKGLEKEGVTISFGEIEELTRSYGRIVQAVLQGRPPEDSKETVSPQ